MERTQQNPGYRDTRTREQLCAALRTLLCTKPLDQIRVREVAEQCGIRRQSFYYHFTDVYELFEWSVDREREQLRRRQAAPPWPPPYAPVRDPSCVCRRSAPHPR